MPDHCQHHEAQIQEVSKLRAITDGQKEWTGKLEQRLERHQEQNTACHEEMTANLVELAGRMDAVTDELKRLRETNIAKLEKDTGDIKTLLQTMQNDMIHVKGAGWMLVKLGGIVLGLVAIVGGVWHMASGK